MQLHIGKCSPTFLSAINPILSGWHPCNRVYGTDQLVLGKRQLPLAVQTWPPKPDGSGHEVKRTAGLSLLNATALAFQIHHDAIGANVGR